jgi:hypothetical protein
VGRESLSVLRCAMVLALVGAITLAPSPVLAQVATGCQVGQSPRFVLGFADLKAELGEVMGEPVTCEFPDPNQTGDVHQRTTTGLAFWRASTNSPTFTNGSEHWARTRAGLVAWTGASIDPPRQATYPQFIIDSFMQGCTRSAPDQEDLCRCAIDRIQSRYALGDFLNLIERTDQDLPPELSAIVLECVLAQP